MTFHEQKGDFELCQHLCLLYTYIYIYKLIYINALRSQFLPGEAGEASSKIGQVMLSLRLFQQLLAADKDSSDSHRQLTCALSRLNPHAEIDHTNPTNSSSITESDVVEWHLLWYPNSFHARLRLKLQNLQKNAGSETWRTLEWTFSPALSANSFTKPAFWTHNCNPWWRPESDLRRLGGQGNWEKYWNTYIFISRQIPSMDP